MAQILIECGADPNQADEGRTPLHWAAERGHEEVAQGGNSIEILTLGNYLAVFLADFLSWHYACRITAKGLTQAMVERFYPV